MEEEEYLVNENNLPGARKPLEGIRSIHVHKGGHLQYFS